MTNGWSIKAPNSLSLAQRGIVQHTIGFSNKLLATINVKEEIKRSLIEDKLREFQEYENRRRKMKHWESRKKIQYKEERRVSQQKARIEKEIKQQRRENGEKAFRDWLKKSMGKLIINQNLVFRIKTKGKS